MKGGKRMPRVVSRQVGKGKAARWGGEAAAGERERVGVREREREKGGRL